MHFFKVSDQLPDCDSTPDSLGVEVRIKPAINGENLAFYGCRIGVTPCFYRYGAQLEGVKEWSYPPTIKVGSRWVERDGRSADMWRHILVVADGRDYQNPLRAPGFESASVVRGKIGIMTTDKDGAPRNGRVTHCSPERFDGRAGNYAPL